MFAEQALLPTLHVILNSKVLNQYPNQCLFKLSYHLLWAVVTGYEAPPLQIKMMMTSPLGYTKIGSGGSGGRCCHALLCSQCLTSHSCVLDFPMQAMASSIINPGLGSSLDS